MPERLLLLDDLKNAKSPEQVTVLFHKLGYNATCQILDVDVFEFPERSYQAINQVYLIANQGNSDLQVILFELHPHEWTSDNVVTYRIQAIANSICQRDSSFLLLATKDYTIELGTTNFVYDPTHYDIRHLPKAIKQIIVAKFSNNQKLLPVVRYMNRIIPGCVVQWPKFCLETEKLDKIRSQNFKTTFQEWYNVLEPYWDYKRPHHDWYGSI